MVNEYVLLAKIERMLDTSTTGAHLEHTATYMKLAVNFISVKNFDLWTKLQFKQVAMASKRRFQEEILCQTTT